MELFSVLRNSEQYTTLLSNELNKNPAKGFVFAMFKSHGRLIIFYKVRLTIFIALKLLYQCHRNTEFIWKYLPTI